jgi:hypothetical protein
MFQNDPMLWSYAGKDREQTLLQEAEDYRRAKRIGGNQPVQARQKLVRTLTVSALIVLWIAWMIVA